jgi:cardiolipin synthase
VDVRLLLPGRTDIPIVRHSGHGFFSSLLAGGVRLFEYDPAVLHAKTMVADGYASVVGSSNIDFRSFERNAECNFALFDPDVGAVMERRFEEDLGSATEIRRPEWRRRSWLHRAGDAMARRLAPVL